MTDTTPPEEPATPPSPYEGTGSAQLPSPYNSATPYESAPYGTPPPGSGYGSPYPPPAPYQSYGQRPPSTILSLLSMIFGIVGIPASCCYGIGIIFSIAAIVLGHLGRKRENAKGMALAGIITGYIGAAEAIIYWLALIGFVFWASTASLNGYNY